jgi:DNA-binding Lrp family transcriptional regulator
MGIIHIDMHIRDERVLAYIQEHYKGKEASITHDQIAAAFGCHRHTAAAIVRRLAGAGHIRIIQRPKRLGYAYEVICQEK